MLSEEAVSSRLLLFYKKPKKYEIFVINRQNRGNKQAGLIVCIDRRQQRSDS